MSLSAYPPEIAAALRRKWRQENCPEDLLPDDQKLVSLLDLMFQVSLLREEGEEIQCRVVLAKQESFTEALHDGLGPIHVLRFQDPISCDVNSLRKLASAAGPYRTLLAVDFTLEGELALWGMINTGTRWVSQVESDQMDGISLPANLVVRTLGPGHLVLSSGYRRLLEAAGGLLLAEGFDPFRSYWLPMRFYGVRESLLMELRAAAGAMAETPQICESFVKDVAQSVVRLTLRLIRNRGHGGTLVYLPDEAMHQTTLDHWFRFRVRFSEDGSTLRLRKLLVSLMQRLLHVGRILGLQKVTYADMRRIHDPSVSECDQLLVEFGHVLADLMSIDGCLVMTRGFKLIGFGAEILGDAHARRIHRALDLEAANSVAESVDAAGTRHRSAYRLVSGLRDALAVVVSQDGAVRFVAWHDDRLVYWPYLP